MKKHITINETEYTLQESIANGLGMSWHDWAREQLQLAAWKRLAFEQMRMLEVMQAGVK